MRRFYGGTIEAVSFCLPQFVSTITRGGINPRAVVFIREFECGLSHTKHSESFWEKLQIKP